MASAASFTVFETAAPTASAPFDISSPASSIHDLVGSTLKAAALLFVFALLMLLVCLLLELALLLILEEEKEEEKEEEEEAGVGCN